MSSAQSSGSSGPPGAGQPLTGLPEPSSHPDLRRGSIFGDLGAVFGDLDSDLRSQSFMSSPWAGIAARAARMQVPAGTWLFRQGDPGDSMYIVASGRLEVVVEKPEEAVIRVLGRGDAVGELALLTETPRSASVRARRDTDLLKVTRDDFTAMLTAEPDFAITLTKVLGEQLRASRGLATPSDPLPTTIAIVALQPGLEVDRFSHDLRDALGAWREVELIDQPEVEAELREMAPEYGRLIDRVERNSDQIVLVAGRADENEREEWKSFCIRTADRILALIDPAAAPPPVDAQLRGCDLVMLPSRAPRANLSAWVDAVQPRAVQVVPAGSDRAASIGRISRRLAGRSVGLVLSGGGARGLAHIGVLEALRDAGIIVDRVGGCSMGAYIGANLALGLSPEEIYARCREEFIERNPMNDYTVPFVSLLRSAKATAMLKRCFGSKRIEELSREFFCVSCDLNSSEQVVHRRGVLWEAVGSSMCLPAVFPPFPMGKRLLVDGGVLNNLPVDKMAITGEGPVIASDVTARFVPPAMRGRRVRKRLARVESAAERARRRLIGRDVPLPSFGETIVRSMGLGSIDTDLAATEYAQLLIVPATGGISLTAWQRVDALREAGRQATREALENAPASLIS